MWHTVIVTATEWENFFHLRCPQYWCNTDNSIHKSKKDWIKHRKIESDRIDKLDEGQATVSFSKGFTKPTNEEWLFLNKGQAEIHMMALAEAMYDALNESTPKKLKAGEWHIPFGDSIKEPKLYSLMASKYGEGLPQPEWSSKFWNMKIQIAIAMCARVSYTVVGEEGKEPNYENDIKLHDRLLKSGHASPFEHVAQSSNINEISGNFLGGWKQYRKILGL
jgi:thymidylate synthase ThyX